MCVLRPHHLSCSVQRKWHATEEPIAPSELGVADLRPWARTRCNIFFSFTSNLISGLREVILYLVKHKHVSVLVTTAGGIEEDFIKCLGKTYLADFHLSGADLQDKGMIRIGNPAVPSDKCGHRAQ